MKKKIQELWVRIKWFLWCGTHHRPNISWTCSGCVEDIYRCHGEHYADMLSLMQKNGRLAEALWAVNADDGAAWLSEETIKAVQAALAAASGEEG